MKKLLFITIIAIGFASSTATAEWLGCMNCSPYDSGSLQNPYGKGSPYDPNGLMNPYSRNGSPYSPDSWTNPYTSGGPKVYDNQGQYRGNLNSNPYDPNSLANPYGRYGNPNSPDSPLNPYSNFNRRFDIYGK